MPYGVYSVSWMEQCTSRILHVLPMILYNFAYFGLLLLPLVGIVVCGFSQILRICVCSLIGGDQLLIY